MESPGNCRLDAAQYGKFSSLIEDYLTKNQNAAAFSHAFPDEINLLKQAREKLAQYDNREITAEVLARQLAAFELHPKQKENLEKFRLSNSVTITTGHQLNLLTGPLYFFHKILQVLKCCEMMNSNHPEFHFIPMFWMATEDHDFEEINHFYFQGRKFTWHKDAKGAVGRLDLEGMDSVFEDFFQTLPATKFAEELKELIRNSYLNSKNLTEATQKLVQMLFGKKGLLMLDGDDLALKKLMIPAFEEDLLKQTAYEKISATNRKLTDLNYAVQVNPREINLFYLGEGGIRERIVQENDRYRVLNSDYQFSKEEILKDLHENPDRYSPNVILRPLYQETVLPNLAYIGGSGECAYWLQLKDFFASQQILFPLIIVRNSLLLIQQRQQRKLEKLGITCEELFLPLQELIHQKVRKNSTVEMDFGKYESRLEHIFDELEKLATQTDVTFSKMVNAERTRQLKGLNRMNQRLMKAEKKKQSELVERLTHIHTALFPQNNLQERVMNFSEIQLECGWAFIDEILKEIQPIDFCFCIKAMP